MLAKFTPFGSHDSGKTTTLRVLTYLLYAKADPTYYVHFHRANKPAKGDIYLSSTALTLSSIFNKKGKNKSADWRISFNIKVPTMEEKTFRIAIATPSDTEEEIIKNWDFTSNNNVYKLSRNEPTYIEPDIFVSPCSEGRARDEEMLEENWHIQHGQVIDFIYKFHLPINETKEEILNKLYLEKDLDKLCDELDNKGVFDAGKKSSSVAKMTRQHKISAIILALLLERKIFEIIKLL